MQPEELAQIGELIEEKLARLVADHPLGPQLLYTRRQAATMLGTSLTTLKGMIRRGDIRVRHNGSAVLITHEELVRVSKHDIATFWSEKANGSREDSTRT